ncbi:MAG: hypothetical protein FWE41_03370 [Coriobacteriia bacterium]|nr:hypothetical protein [Coriobacteriia bacterium]MCL2749610.1 hypothetical protein [Coriobacteriia bacterium]
MASQNATKSTTAGAEVSEKVTGTKIPTAMIPKELYADIIQLAAYNKIKKIGPQSDSAILREALTALMKHVGYKPHDTDILAAPKASLVKKLASIHQDAQLDGGIRKTFSVSIADYDAAEGFASYNKLHGLLPKNVSQLCRDALTFYISQVEYKFRPE